MNILITGVHGFVGSNLVESLKEKHDIYGLDIVSPTIKGVVHTYGCDDLDSVLEPDVVIHLARKVHDTRSKQNEELYFGMNNLGDDESLSTNELIEYIAGASGKSKRIWKINKKLIKYFAYAGSLLNLPLNNHSLRKLTENYVVSNRKLKKSLNIQFLPFNTSEGVRKTIKSFEI